MIVTMQADFSATTHKEAVERATLVWQSFTDDPSAELPWDAVIHVQLDHEEVKDVMGKVVTGAMAGTATLSVKVAREG